MIAFPNWILWEETRKETKWLINYHLSISIGPIGLNESTLLGILESQTTRLEPVCQSIP